jgi:uncharacterized membrane protein
MNNEIGMDWMNPAKRAACNVSDTERWISVVGGGLLLAYGMYRRDKTGLALTGLGGMLVQRGATGHCYMYQAFGVNTCESTKTLGQGVPYELGVRIDKSITVDKPAAELYSFWRKLDNLPRFMKNVNCVKVLDERRSHWEVKTLGGKVVQWDAEIINDEPNRVIGWRSLEGSDVDVGGSVRFEEQPNGRGTAVKVSMQYNPPAGFVGAGLAKLFKDPASDVEEDLRRFKQLMETGEVATTEGQPVGATRSDRKPRAENAWDRDKVTASSEESFPASDPPSWTPETL